MGKKKKNIKLNIDITEGIQDPRPHHYWDKHPALNNVKAFVLCTLGAFMIAFVLNSFVNVIQPFGIDVHQGNGGILKGGERENILHKFPGEAEASCADKGDFLCCHVSPSVIRFPAQPVWIQYTRYGSLCKRKEEKRLKEYAECCIVGKNGLSNKETIWNLSYV